MKLTLDTGWKVKYEDLTFGAESAGQVLASAGGWMDAALPCDVHMPLMACGIIQDPVVADFSDGCRWVEDKSWWFKTEFELESAIAGGDAVELVCEMLDIGADIFINGVHIGHHASAFRPFVADVRECVKAGLNTLLVRLTTGVERVDEGDLAGIEHCVATEADAGRGDRGDKRRACLRKPQYSFGWDWGPRVATCGIMGSVTIHAYDGAAIRRIHCVTKSTAGPAEVEIEAEIENLHPFSTLDSALSLVVRSPGGEVVAEVETDALLISGLNYMPYTVRIPNPDLWWPNGMGRQPLYTASLTVLRGGASIAESTVRFGVRTIAVEMERFGGEELGFAFRVNGVKTFCKGANWIPADSVYARVTDEKYARLVREAAESNFNMLRVWGGGLYEREVFYDLCDACGILVWQDFMFACAVYPDKSEEFRREAELEMDYQTRRLAGHPCMALWCGNNEIAQGFDTWWIGQYKPAYLGGVYCYNRIAPAIVRKNCPEIFYWNSSPYGGENPNGDLAGDKHHWAECMMSSDMEARITPEEFDDVTAKFVSEYGYPGPCRKESIARYLGGAPLDRTGCLWQLHNNTFEKDTVCAGITKHYRDAADIDMDDYLLYASLCQGLMLGYSLEALRCNMRCWGALYWMYNDCWGETGWTTLDYYLARKPSYYFVRRAFEPVKLILRRAGGQVRVTGMNDTAELRSFEAEYGYASFDGSVRFTQRSAVVLPPFSRQVLFSFEMGGHDARGGCHFVEPLDEQGDIGPAVLRTTEFRNLRIPTAALTIYALSVEGGVARFTVSADRYAHAVHFGLPEQLTPSDEYFDLLPGRSRRIEVRGISPGFDVHSIRCRCVTAE